MQDDHTQKQA